MEFSNQQLIHNIQKGDVAAFKELYRQYYVFLCMVAEHIVKNHAEAEEIVSDVFVKLWNIREKIIITTSIKAYLTRAVRNTSLNYLEKNKTIHNLTDSLSNPEYELLAWGSDYPLGQLYNKEIMKLLDQGIRSLPAACREIFLLSRNQDLKYIDIADKLSISVNTVKTQMRIALARLQETLKDYMMILFVFTLIS